jgi:hypothetical protein
MKLWILDQESIALMIMDSDSKTGERTAYYLEVLLNSSANFITKEFIIVPRQLNVTFKYI